MKLRTVTALCLVVYLGASTVITVAGLWAQPATSTKIATVTQPAETPSRSTKTEIPLDMEGLSNSAKTSQPTPSTTTQAGTTTVATPTPTPKTTSPTTTTKTPASPAPAPAPTPSPAPKPAPVPTPAPAPVPKPIACGQAGGTCTAAQVATHKLQSNCWQIYNGGYYIVTSYVAEHPGGKSVFNSSTCGVDITGYMNGSQSTGGKKRKHSSGAYRDLESYYVGKVQG